MICPVTFAQHCIKQCIKVNSFNEVHQIIFSLSLSAISGDVSDHGMPQLSVSSFLKQYHFLMSYTSLCYPCIFFLGGLVIQIVCFLHLPLFPSILPVSARFSRPSFLITHPKNLICLVLISPINFLSTPALCRTSSLVNLSVQGILIIRLKNHISQLSNHFLRSGVIVHASLPYNNIDDLW